MSLLMGKFDHYNANPFESLEKRILAGEFVPPEFAVHRIRNRGDAPIPETIIEYRSTLHIGRCFGVCLNFRPILTRDIVFRGNP